MEKNHRQGRTGARTRALRRAHARRLLATLARICRLLCRKQACPIAREAYREVERDLLRLQGHARKQVPVRSTKRRGS